MTEEEMLELVRKYRERQQVDQSAEYHKLNTLAKRKGEALAEAEAVTLRRAHKVTAWEVRPQATEWLWDGRVPLGEISLLAGKGGVGKSTVFAWFVAKLTRGSLKGKFFGQPRDVIYIATEDSIAKTLVPRLMAAGADLKRVHILRVENVLTGKLQGLTLPLDCELLAEVVDETQSVAIFVDPLSSTLKAVKNRNDPVQVRAAMEELREFADHFNLAVFGLAHLRKQTSDNVMEAIAGSAEYGNVVRAALGAVPDPDDDQGSYVLSQEKNNLGRLDIPSWRYQIVSRSITDYMTGEIVPGSIGKVKMIEETDVTASEIMGDSITGSSTPDAVEWLRHVLHAQPIAASDILNLAKKESISRATVFRAAKKLKVQKVRNGYGGGVTWSL